MRIERELRNLDKHLSLAERRWQTSMEKVNVRKAVVAMWASHIQEVKEIAAEELRQMTHAPKATFHVLKAVNYLLKDDPDQFFSWAGARKIINSKFFERAVAMDGEAERDMDAWGKARMELKPVDDAKLPEETPKSNIGSLLRKMIRAMRALANKVQSPAGCVISSCDMAFNLLDHDCSVSLSAHSDSKSCVME